MTQTSAAVGYSVLDVSDDERQIRWAEAIPTEALDELLGAVALLR